MNNIRKIGVDLDGVLIDKSKFMLENGKNFFRGKVRFINYCSSKFTEMFNCSKEVSEIFWKKYMHKYCLQSNPEMDSVDVLKKLKEDGNEIYIITSRDSISDRSFIGEIQRGMLKHWLNKNEIPFDGIVYCDKNNSYVEKYQACQKIGMDIVIEDKVNDAIALSEISRVVLLARPYNVGLNTIDRVDNFKDVYDAVSNVKRRKCK